ncbi:single-strand binding protein [Mariniphaga anaerophila]|uniref:Single-stranded DNA-binding protein n=1 Tax=Mariniphaga anaerophila TaxID=1484053 RepID=A0A1M4W734_9BACT|nr:single-stranded DNA-binding protein [Mariniphaga anaerophila]SHE76960.1 single-strand binding protein [Mariniphaga anaerophila]
MAVNKVILVGNVGKDPEIRHLDSGVAVASFPLATSESYTAKNGDKVSTTEWHNIVAWRGLAEVTERYVNKGRQLYIEGKIKTRSWDDKDGNKRYTTEIVADVLQLLGSRTDNQQGDSQKSSSYNTPQSEPSGFQSAGEPDIAEPADDDDLPF